MSEHWVDDPDYTQVEDTTTDGVVPRMGAFTAGYDAGRHNRVVVLSDDPDWLDGFITGRADAHNA